ncbi:hypothetical protein Tco_0302419 [Tanacetum coccineum]
MFEFSSCLLADSAINLVSDSAINAQKRLSSGSCWKLLISSIFFALWAGGQYLFRNLVLRTSQVVIDPDGWFLSLAAPMRDTGKA